MITIDQKKIKNFCDRWKVIEFSIFGSALREDFRPDSDVDVLVAFAPGTNHGLFELVRMQRELSTLFGREVDLVSRHGIESSRNPIRRNAILGSAKTIYAA